MGNSLRTMKPVLRLVAVLGLTTLLLNGCGKAGTTEGITEEPTPMTLSTEPSAARAVMKSQLRK
jgi:hypothetical protein